MTLATKNMNLIRSHFYEKINMLRDTASLDPLQKNVLGEKYLDHVAIRIRRTGKQLYAPRVPGYCELVPTIGDPCCDFQEKIAGMYCSFQPNSSQVLSSEEELGHFMAHHLWGYCDPEVTPEGHDGWPYLALAGSDMIAASFYVSKTGVTLDQVSGNVHYVHSPTGLLYLLLNCGVAVPFLSDGTPCEQQLI